MKTKMETRSTTTSSARDMQSVISRSLPFKNDQMNFFFVLVTGADVYGGATLGESYCAANQIKDGNIETWIKAFGEVAGRAEEQAKTLLAKGRCESAREVFLRASNYYFGADHYTDALHPKYMEYWQRSVECFRRACALSTPPIDILSYTLDGHELPAYFVHAQGPARGTMLAMSGFDGTAETKYFACGAGLARRGYNVLMFEGPGHRGVSHRYHDLPFRTNYETVVEKVVDLALTREDIHPGRIGLIGYSFGGHLALRAAAFEPRIKALIANSPVSDFGKMMLDGFPPFATQMNDRMIDWLMTNAIQYQPQPLQASLKRLYEAMGVTHFSDFRRRMAEYRFDNIEQIPCPVLCLISEGEGINGMSEALGVFERLPNPQKAFVSFGAEQGADIHCQFNNLALAVETMADWLDEIWKYPPIPEGRSQKKAK
jgi:pimeloyl-ACP methyl ester carboxylesterase